MSVDTTAGLTCDLLAMLEERYSSGGLSSLDTPGY